MPIFTHQLKLLSATGWCRVANTVLEPEDLSLNPKLLGVTGRCRVANMVLESDVSSSNPGGCDLSK
jgi:hypothetical protein